MIAFILTVFQSIASAIPTKIFLTILAVIILAERITSYYKDYSFGKGHHIREIGLFDNSFNGKRIPNYDSKHYYDNTSIINKDIRFLANIHESSFFTLHIVGDMLLKYYCIVGILFLFFLVKLLINGIDDYLSIFLSYLASSSFLDRTFKLNSLKKASEYTYEKANEICEEYEKFRINSSIILSKIIEVSIFYESSIFESKIILSDKIYRQQRKYLDDEWVIIRDNYKIYKNLDEI